MSVGTEINSEVDFGDCMFQLLCDIYGDSQVSAHPENDEVRVKLGPHTAAISLITFVSCLTDVGRARGKEIIISIVALPSQLSYELFISVLPLCYLSQYDWDSTTVALSKKVPGSLLLYLVS